jgi:hypothetical protein
MFRETEWYNEPWIMQRVSSGFHAFHCRRLMISKPTTFILLMWMAWKDTLEKEYVEETVLVNPACTSPVIKRTGTSGRHFVHADNWLTDRHTYGNLPDGSNHRCFHHPVFDSSYFLLKKVTFRQFFVFKCNFAILQHTWTSIYLNFNNFNIF